MNIFTLFRTTCQTIGFIAPKLSSVESFARIINNNVHHIYNKQYSNFSSMHVSKITSKLLQPLLPIHNFTCGLKTKTILHRRCKHCLLMWKNDRKYIICKAKARHNQMERIKKDKSTWILTHATQSKIREW